MQEVLVWVLGFSVVSALVVAGSVAYALWRLRRRNRVCATHPSSAPLHWLVSPAPGARLHRRLRNAVAVAHLAGAHARVPELVAEVEEHALALDHHVVITAQLARRERQRRWRQLDRQIADLEALTARLVTASVEAAHRPALPSAGVDPLARIAERLDALEAARDELVGVERSAGLDRPAAQYQ